MSDPLHGVTLEALLTALVDRHGWDELARRVPIRCFTNEPTVRSSLKFLRKTPWARARVEALYIDDERKLQKKRERNRRRKARRRFATLPLERDDTLAFAWPSDATTTFERPPDVTVSDGIDRDAFIAVQGSIGFDVTPSIWDRHVFARMLVARIDDRPVAVATAEEREHGWMELTWVAVAPDVRGRGLGRLVCSVMVSTLLEQGHRQLFGSTTDDRIHALRIYLSIGFEPVRREGKEARWDAVMDRLDPSRPST